LRSVPAPPALRGEAALCPVEVLRGQALPRLELVEPRGEPFAAPCYRTIGPLAHRQPVLLPGGLASCPLACLGPFLLRDFPLEAGEISRDRPVAACLLRCRLGPLVRFFVADDPPVRWAPPDLDDNAWSGPAQRGNVLPRLECVLLTGARFVRRHSSDGRLRIFEDCYPSRDRIPLRCLLECPGRSGALCIIGLLIAAHVHLCARPGSAPPPHYRVSGRPILQP